MAWGTINALFKKGVTKHKRKLLMFALRIGLSGGGHRKCK